MKNIHEFPLRVIFLPSFHHGAGTTTIAKALLKILGKDAVFISGGKKMRALAEKAHMPLRKFIDTISVKDELEFDNYSIRKIINARKRNKIIILDSCIGHDLCKKAGVPFKEIFTVNVTCDSDVAGKRVFDARLKKAQSDRKTDSDLPTPQQVAQELESRTQADTARYKERYGVDISNIPSDVTIDTTRLDETSAFLEVFSAWVEACEKFIQTVNGPSQCGKTFTASSAATDFETEFIDTGIYYRACAVIRTLLGNKPVNKHFLSVLEEVLFSSNLKENLVNLESAFQSGFVSGIVNFTSSEHEVRKLVALVQARAVYLALLKSNIVFVAGRDTYNIFKRTKSKHIWLENTDKKQIVLRAFAGKGKHDPSPDEVATALKNILERDRADKERPHGSYNYDEKIMAFFDTKDLTKVEQVKQFSQLVRELMAS